MNKPLRCKAKSFGRGNTFPYAKDNLVDMQNNFDYSFCYHVLHVRGLLTATLTSMESHFNEFYAIWLEARGPFCQESMPQIVVSLEIFPPADPKPSVQHLEFWFLDQILQLHQYHRGNHNPVEESHHQLPPECQAFPFL